VSLGHGATSLLGWMMNRARSLRPIYVAILAAGIAAQIGLIHIDAFDLLYQFTRAHEDWQVDEWFTGLSVLAFVFLAFLIVRTGDLKREASRRSKAEQQLEAALNNMGQGLVMFDRHQRLVLCNQRYADMYGYAPEALKPGSTLRQILQARSERRVYPEEISNEYAEKLLTSMSENKPTTHIVELRDGRTIAVKRNPMSGGWVATHDDISEQRRMSDQLAYLAHHDSLTDLPNRVLLRRSLDQSLARLKRGAALAVLSLDLDYFKQINDTLGHPAGDALLKVVAERLCGCVGESDLVARMGGDEFTLLQTAAAQPDATALASRIIDALGAPYDIDGQQVTAGVSIGIAVAPIDGSDADQLLKNADLALYRAKSEGRGTYRFFEPEMNEQAQRRRKLELDLRKALAGGQFEVHYQPVFDLNRNEVTGFEALLRWFHAERGKVAPSEFIPLAEETGLIVPIGEWVLRKACIDAAPWPDHVGIAVNLSPVQFKSPTLVQTVMNAMAASGLAARRLELEITETVLLQDSEATLSTLHQLRALGVHIVMDDFGTGYSSLSYLQSFPFDKIKVDRRFVSGLDRSANSLAILRAVASLGNSLGISTTAEGVETEEQFARVRAEGFTETQGFLISPPVPIQEVARLLKLAARAAPAQASAA